MLAYPPPDDDDNKSIFVIYFPVSGNVGRVASFILRSQVVVKRDEKKIRPFPRRVYRMPAAHRGVGPHLLGLTMLFFVCVCVCTCSSFSSSTCLNRATRSVCVFELRTSAALRIIYYNLLGVYYTAGESEDPYFLPKYTVYTQQQYIFFPI